MTDPKDRIPVPTNGHRPPLEGAEAPTGEPARTGESAPTGESARTAGPPPIVRPETTVAFSPGQLAIGFGILAGLALLVLGRRRRGGRG